MGAKRAVGALDRAFCALLLLLMVIGAFALWIGVPAGILWGLGKLVDNKTEHLVLGLLAVPLGMVLFGIVLVRLNWAYLRVSGAELRSEEEDEWVPRLRGPLDRIVGVSAVIALVAFLAWMIFGETTTGSVPPW
jgi:ABC-type dipeptide/oligopeptide/nickel transport system permease component